MALRQDWAEIAHFLYSLCLAPALLLAPLCGLQLAAERARELSQVGGGVLGLRLRQPSVPMPRSGFGSASASITLAVSPLRAAICRSSSPTIAASCSSLSLPMMLPLCSTLSSRGTS